MNSMYGTSAQSAGRHSAMRLTSTAPPTRARAWVALHRVLGKGRLGLK